MLGMLTNCCDMNTTQQAAMRHLITIYSATRIGN